MIKKITMLVLVLSVCAMFLYSGGANQNPQNTTVTYGSWGSVSPAMEAIAEVFNQESGITIEYEVTPWAQYWTKLEASASSGAAPDLFRMNGPNLLLYKGYGIIEAASDHIDFAGMSGLAPSALDIYTDAGKVWGVPITFDTIGVYCNTQLFDQAGVGYPEAEWTWADMRSLALQLREKLPGGVWPLGLEGSWQTGTYAIIPAAGGRVISPDRRRTGYRDPGTLTALQKIRELYDEELVVPIDTMMEESRVIPRFFISGKVAMAFLGPWEAANVDESTIGGQTQIMEIPAITQKGNVIHGIASVLFANSKNKDNAVELLTFLAGDKTYELYAKHLEGFPANLRYAPLFAQSFQRVDIAAHTRAAEYASPYPFSVNTGKWASFEGSTINNMLAGKLSVEEAAEEVAVFMQKSLDEEKR